MPARTLRSLKRGDLAGILHQATHSKERSAKGVMLAAAGSFIGVCAAHGAIHLLTVLIPVNMLMDLPYLQGPGLNVHVMGFAVAIGLAMAILLSLTPAFRLSLTDCVPG